MDIVEIFSTGRQDIVWTILIDFCLRCFSVSFVYFDSRSVITVLTTRLTVAVTNKVVCQNYYPGKWAVEVRSTVASYDIRY